MKNRIDVFWIDKSNGIINNPTLLKQIQQTIPEIQQLELTYNENRKPFLKHNPIYHISISHTKTKTLLAISQQPLGIDIEIIEPGQTKNNQQTVQNFFAPKEKKKLAQKSKPQSFYILWTRKEALIKLLETYLSEEFLNINVLPNKITYQNQKISFNTITKFPNHVISVATFTKFHFSNQVIFHSGESLQ